MCGRYTLITGGDQVAEQFLLDFVPVLTPRYNIAPTQAVAMVRQPDPAGPRQLAWVRWGLIPSWATDPAIGNRLINARSETVAEKPSFRSALRQRRCLVLADGFFEWQAEGRKKRPFWFRRRDGRPFGLAGLWERWQGPDRQPVESCTVLTTEANEVVRPVHDRMPVFLDPADQARWLDPSQKQAGPLLPLLRPCPAADLVATEVSPRVNDPRHDGPDCIAPARPPDLFDGPAPSRAG
jgi:putative SOS response-associated peptidase YedK